MELKVINSVVSKPEDVSMTPREEKKLRVFKAPKVELSEGIKAYEEKLNKPKVIMGNPFDFTQVAIKKQPIPSELVAKKEYNIIGKFLGVDTVHDWNKSYDRVYDIVEWAKKNTGSEDIDVLMKWLGEKQRTLPNIGAKKY